MSSSPFLSNCTADTIREAAAALKAGHLVAFPTETVYGLGADARNLNAVKRIYEVKGRPSDHPLIVHISSISELDKWAIEIPGYAIKLAREFWPGPMTLILKKSELVRDFITGGQESVGLRVPSHPIALALIKEFEKISDSAIAAPSANRFGQVSPTSSGDVYEELGEFLFASDLILDGGNSPIGIESTIIDCRSENPRILRPGFVSTKDVEVVTGISIDSKKIQNLVKFSGSFEKHYSPNCRILVNTSTNLGDAFLALAEVDTPDGAIRIASPDSELAFARVLYSSFREADRRGFQRLVVFPPPGDGLSHAIKERLEKASYNEEN
jgi:L-threonylcarbamoyladenylate synthase